MEHPQPFSLHIDIKYGTQPTYFKIPNYNGTSIVDALRSIGAESSFNYRRSIAAINHICEGEFRGRPQENLAMLNLLKQGKLIMPQSN